ncbi:hypothetical protein NADFUDRAFT_83897 [Nadsonia fulvescens var. elongata DSM 6958]|uniref:Translation initiation factor IF-2, mitochondrial n=1 Tax=Nadsonia fulvescens var. elongata DSM 6958 TaxID=857566 RepID=A0A1E3PG77_9ASCO|nr:hypothetical protein NADFUDRAFT_83897 [Nadsonia fulvescens var. elongata DSM 6958]
MGIDKLEEAIITLSEIQDLRGDPKGNVEGWVIESQVKKGLGNVATVLVRRGTIKPGITIVAGNVWCKVRSIKDDKGKILKQADPGAPVEIIGWKDLPEAGDEVLQSKTENEAKQAINNRLERAKRVREAKDIEIINQKRHMMKIEQEKEQAKLERIRLGLPEEDPNADITSTKPGVQEVNFIVRADVSGSVEAIVESIEGLGNKEIKVRVLSSGVGSPSLSDLERAEVSNATVLAFNVKVEKEVMNKSLRSNTPIKQHNIIYKLLEDVTEILTDNLPTETKIKVLGEAMIKDVFEITGKRNSKVRVAGCKVSNGLIKRGALVRVFRGKEGSNLSEKKEVYKGKVDSLKHHKDDINEIKKDKECGIGFDGWKNFEQGDIIQTYEEFEVKRHL